MTYELLACSDQHYNDHEICASVHMEIFSKDKNALISISIYLSVFVASILDFEMATTVYHYIHIHISQ